MDTAISLEELETPGSTTPRSTPLTRTTLEFDAQLAAEHKRPGVIRHLLRATVALFADKLNGIEMLEPPFSNP